jgi:hypothetical protein
MAEIIEAEVTGSETIKGINFLFILMLIHNS